MLVLEIVRIQDCSVVFRENLVMYGDIGFIDQQEKSKLDFLPVLRY